MKWESFQTDKRTPMAVCMALILIGEATVRIMTDNPDFLTIHPEVPWSKMEGMRNLVAHEYPELPLSIIWDTTQTALPGLISELQSILNWHAQGE